MIIRSRKKEKKLHVKTNNILSFHLSIGEAHKVRHTRSSEQKERILLMINRIMTQKATTRALPASPTFYFVAGKAKLLLVLGSFTIKGYLLPTVNQKKGIERSGRFRDFFFRILFLFEIESLSSYQPRDVVIVKPIVEKGKCFFGFRDQNSYSMNRPICRVLDGLSLRVLAITPFMRLLVLEKRKIRSSLPLRRFKVDESEANRDAL